MSFKIIIDCFVSKILILAINSDIHMVLNRKDSTRTYPAIFPHLADGNNIKTPTITIILVTNLRTPQ